MACPRAFEMTLRCASTDNQATWPCTQRLRHRDAGMRQWHYGLLKLKAGATLIPPASGQKPMLYNGKSGHQVTRRPMSLLAIRRQIFVEWNWRRAEMARRDKYRQNPRMLATALII